VIAAASLGNGSVRGSAHFNFRGRYHKLCNNLEIARGVLRVSRKQVRGKLGSVTRKKRAPKEYPVEPELAAILKEHRMHLLKDQAPGLANGLMFPSTVGTYRTPNSLDAAWAKCLTAAQIGKRFTIHGLRYTFTDLVRLANVDAVVRRALTGHVTEEMQRHYSTVGLEEKRAAVAGVLRLVPPEARAKAPTLMSSTADGVGASSTVNGAIASSAVSGAIASPTVSGAIASPTVSGAIASPAVNGAVASPTVNASPTAHASEGSSASSVLRRLLHVDRLA
jgi:hypothetical protein